MCGVGGGEIPGRNGSVCAFIVSQGRPLVTWKCCPKCFPVEAARTSRRARSATPLRTPRPRNGREATQPVPRRKRPPPCGGARAGAFGSQECPKSCSRLPTRQVGVCPQAEFASRKEPPGREWPPLTGTPSAACPETQPSPFARTPSRPRCKVVTRPTKRRKRESVPHHSESVPSPSVSESVPPILESVPLIAESVPSLFHPPVPESVPTIVESVPWPLGGRYGSFHRPLQPGSLRRDPALRSRSPDVWRNQKDVPEVFASESLAAIRPAASPEAKRAAAVVGTDSEAGPCPALLLRQGGSVPAPPRPRDRASGTLRPGAERPCSETLAAHRPRGPRRAPEAHGAEAGCEAHRPPRW